MQTKAAMACGAVVAAVLVAMTVFAGELAPPAGPVAGTMKSLAEIEPRTPISSLPFDITQPGSYYLTGNLSTATYGIRITAPDVSIDMMGFTITGSTPDEHIGVEVAFNSTGNFALRNGTVRRFRTGVAASDDLEHGGNNTVIGVRALEIGLSGIDLRSRNNLIRDCSAERSETTTVMFLSSGIVVTGGVMENCRVSGFGYGLGGIAGAVIQNSMAQDCDTGAVVFNGVIRGCAFFGISAQSIELGGGAVAFENYAP